MKIGDLVRDLFGKRHEEAAHNTQSAPAQPEAAKALTEQDLEQVQGGASVIGLPITSVPYFKIEILPTIGDPHI